MEHWITVYYPAPNSRPTRFGPFKTKLSAENWLENELIDGIMDSINIKSIVFSQESPQPVKALESF